MNVSTLATTQTKPFGGNRKLATAHAKAAVLRSDLQEQMKELGGFVWKVEMWPNWLSISVDALGNDTTDIRQGRKAAEDWAETHQEKLQELFSGVLGEQFGELSIMGRNMGAELPYGGCCRTGCGGCLNGAKDKLVDKVRDTNTPVDTFSSSY